MRRVPCGQGRKLDHYRPLVEIVLTSGWPLREGSPDLPDRYKN